MSQRDHPFQWFLNSIFLEHDFTIWPRLISCRWPGGIPEPAGCGDQTWTSPLADHLPKTWFTRMTGNIVFERCEGNKKDEELNFYRPYISLHDLSKARLKLAKIGSVSSEEAQVVTWCYMRMLTSHHPRCKSQVWRLCTLHGGFCALQNGDGWIYIFYYFVLESVEEWECLCLFWPFECVKWWRFALISIGFVFGLLLGKARRRNYPQTDLPENPSSIFNQM